MTHMLLIGGGHAHVAVLADWIKRGLPCERATLLTPETHLRYSGMVPGWIAGRYDRDEGTVDIAALAQRAGAQFVQARCSEIDPVANAVVMDTGERIAFDIASIDTGGVGRARDILGNDPRILDVRPIDRFVEQLAQSPDAAKTVIVGGGAGGVELAFALRASRTDLRLVTGAKGLLSGFSEAVRERVRAQLARQDIMVIEADARITAGMLYAGDQSLEPAQQIIAALGSGAPDWPRAGGLACDAAGFIAVDAHQRSTSHPQIFAAGDVAARQDCDVPHSGVHAVHTGPILAANLRRVLAGGEPRRSYIPRENSLYLIATGNGSAIASYGARTAQGRWVGRLKHWIDKRWLSQYSSLTHDV